MWQKKQTVEREEEKSSETRKLSFNPHSTQQLVHVITLLHFLVLKVNIDKPIILLPSSIVVVGCAATTVRQEQESEIQTRLLC